MNSQIRKEKAGTFINPDVRVSVYWTDERLAKYSISIDDIIMGRVSYEELVAREEEFIRRRQNE